MNNNNLDRGKHIHYRRWLVLLCFLLLSACAGTAAAPQPPTTSPPAVPSVATASAPTAVPSVTTAPASPVVVQPTAVEAAAGAPPTAAAQPGAASPTAALLPAPLYFLHDGQIWRLERDGATRSQVTEELIPVAEYDIGPRDGALAYITSPEGQDDRRTLVMVDAAGAHRTELITGPVASPRIEPDGDRIAFELYQALDGLEIGKQRSEPGIWMTFRSGGRPSPLQRDEPIPDPDHPPDDARRYYPIAWSPDGGQLLIGVYFPVGEGGLLAVKRKSDGAVVDIEDAVGEARWNLDGTAITIAGGSQIQDAHLGLWRADPAAGKVTQLIAGSDGDKVALITAAHELRDGNMYGFLTFMQDPPFDRPIPVSMYRVSRDGKPTQLRRDSYALADALWADDASGAVIAEDATNASDARLSWLPADGSSARRPIPNSRR